MTNVNETTSDTEVMAPAQPDRYVFVWRTNSWAGFQTQLARTLKERFGIKSVLFRYNATGGPSTKLFEFDPDDFTEIIDLDQEMTPRPVAELPAGQEIYDRAIALERQLGRPLNDILRTDRHFGIGFVSGASFMRSKLGHNTNHAQCLDMMVRINARVQPLLEKYQPITILGSPGTLAQSMLIASAESMDIPMRRLVSARQGKKCYWSEDWASTPLGLHQAYEKHFNRLKAELPVDGADLDSEENAAMPPKPYTAELTLRAFRGRSTLKFLAKWFYQISRTEFGKRVRGQSFRYGNYLFRDRLKHGLQRWMWRRQTLREPRVFSELPTDLPFVFYPLHIEPESTLFTEAQSADHQLAHIDMMVKTLPAGWHLIVKEHFAATANRPPGFWERINGYPNVIVAATLENAEAIAQRSKAVATVNGTLGLQAAMVGHPTITFFPEFQALCAPHVQLATSYRETREAFVRIRDNELPARSIGLIAGRAFAAATEDATFFVNDAGMLSGVAANSPAAEKAEVENLAQTLMDSLHVGVLSDQDQGAVRQPA